MLGEWGTLAGDAKLRVGSILRPGYGVFCAHPLCGETHWGCIKGQGCGAVLVGCGHVASEGL